MAKRKRNAAVFQQPYFVIGKNPVRELFKDAPERVEELISVVGGRGKRGLEEQVALAEQFGISWRELPPEELSSLVGTESHQGIAARAHPPEVVSLGSLCQLGEVSGRVVLLLLDSIFDPQNFGALLRAAEGFGVAGVIWSRNRGSSVTPAVTKASAGASELVPLCPVGNLVQAVQRLKRAGFWTVAAHRAEDAVSCYEESFPDKIALVLGSEGAGVQPLLQREVDQRLAIPMQGRIDSLNVSQAGAVLLSQLTR